jgi:TetR/AcrR family transcriptional regulator, tetracycline repressor protein
VSRTLTQTKSGRTSESYRAKGRITLTRADVVEAATHLLDVEGVDALSMRRVAAALGTGPSTLYWHVRDREQLLGLVLDATLASIEPASTGSWRQRVFSVVDQLRRAMVARPVLIPVVLGARWDVGTHGLRLADHALGLLSEAGIPEAHIAESYFILLHYTLGAAQAETHASWNASFEAEAAARGDVSPIDEADMSAYPYLVRFGPGTQPEDMARRFESGIETILGGLLLTCEREKGFDRSTPHRVARF